MEAEKSTPEESEILSEGEANDPRQRSTIGFPYADLSDAETVAFAVYNNVAYGRCGDDQLAPWLKLSVKSSGFRIRVAAARMFGVIDTESGQHFLTPVGKMIVDPVRQREGRVLSFLAVPLFARVFAEYKGTTLPPAAAFERAIEGMGVAPKQKSRARQVLERSADQAGFFAHGAGRLVRPGATVGVDPAEKPKKREDDGADGGQGGNGDGIRPELDGMIRGLINKIPAGKTDWPVADRAKWLTAAATIFDLVYEGDGEIKISVKDALSQD